MKKSTLIFTLFIMVNIACERNLEQTDKVVPKPFYVRLLDLETKNNLLFGESPRYCPDSLKLALYNTIYYPEIIYNPVRYDTLREAIIITTNPVGNINEKIFYLKFIDFEIDTIILVYKDVIYNESEKNPMYSYTFSLEYNDLLICTLCSFDSIYKIYK